MRFKILLIGALLLMATATAQAQEIKLVVYTSMKDSLMLKLCEAFQRQHPEIPTTYRSAGAGALMEKIEEERMAGKIVADVLWTSEVPDFYMLKQGGMLEKYISPLASQILNPFKDFDGSFTPARLGTLGIAYNTNIITTAPRDWSDIWAPEYQGRFGIANPTRSGTGYLSIALLVKEFGWPFLEKIGQNHGQIGKGSGQVVKDTAEGALAACIAVDYITFDLIAKGAPLALIYPLEMLVIPSPVAIFKGTPNLEAACKFVDFLLSYQAQIIIAREGTLPVRDDVILPALFQLPSPGEAMRRAIVINYIELMAAKEGIVKRFFDIMLHEQ